MIGELAVKFIIIIACASVVMSIIYAMYYAAAAVMRHIIMRRLGYYHGAVSFSNYSGKVIYGWSRMYDHNLHHVITITDMTVDNICITDLVKRVKSIEQSVLGGADDIS